MHASQPAGDKPRGSDLEHFPVSRVQTFLSLHLELRRDFQLPTAAREPTPVLLPPLGMPQPRPQAKDRRRYHNGPEGQDRRLWAIRVMEGQAASGPNSNKKFISGDSRPCPTDGGNKQVLVKCGRPGHETRARREEPFRPRTSGQTQGERS